MEGQGSRFNSFTYHELPKKYWKKYKFAAQFISIVKSKTPKVSVYICVVPLTHWS